MKFFLSRAGGAIVVLLLVSLILFTMLKSAAGDAADILLPDLATPEDAARLRERWGLDQPIIVQFGKFLWNGLHLDFGGILPLSPAGLGAHCRAPAGHIELALSATLAAIVIGLAAGLTSAMYKGRLPDAILSLASVAGVSAPSSGSGSCWCWSSPPS